MVYLYLATLSVTFHTSGDAWPMAIYQLVLQSVMTNRGRYLFLLFLFIYFLFSEFFIYFLVVVVVF